MVEGSGAPGCSSIHGLAGAEVPANGPGALLGSIRVHIVVLPGDPGVVLSTLWPKAHVLGCGARCKATQCASGLLELCRGDRA